MNFKQPHHRGYKKWQMYLFALVFWKWCLVRDHNGNAMGIKRVGA